MNSVDIIKAPEAKRAIAEAQTVEDTLKIKAFLDAKYQEYKSIYQSISKLDTAQNHNREIKDSLVLLGELKLLNEAKLGEILKSIELPGRGGGDTKASQPTVRRLEDMGITYNESSRAQQIYEHKDLIPEVIEQAKAEDKPPTIERMMNAIREKPAWTNIYSSKEIEWYTPKQYIDAVYEVLGEIDLDPASCFEANQVVQANEFYSKEVDGLSNEWHGKVFLNPPWGKDGGKFAKKFITEFQAGHITEGIVLVNSNSTDTDWFQPLFDGVLCFTDHRIDFYSPAESQNSSTHGSVFIYFGGQERVFAKVFKKFGNVVKRFHDN